MHARMPLTTALLTGGVIAVLIAAPVEAQPRRRANAVHPGPARTTVVYVRPPYRPYYGSPMWAYDPWLWSPYGPYHPGFYPGSAFAGDSGIRLDVEPRDAEVFVNGYFTGVVDDFDGFFQHLSLPPGEYTITVYREGYRSISEQVLVRPGITYRLSHELVALAPGDPADPRPVPAPAPSGEQLPPPRPWSPPRWRGMPPVEPSGDARFGELAIQVQPPDAEVLIDGEAWRSPGGTDRLIVHLPAGPHRVEVRMDGYDTFVTDVQIDPGEDTTLNVSLRR